jgi:hypothetical protein
LINLGRRQRKRSGISEVFATTILSAALLIVVIVAFGYTIYILGIESASREFDQAQGIMKSYENLIEDLIYRPDSSAFIRFTFKTSGPSFIQTGNNIVLTVSNGVASYTPLSSNNASIAVFQIRGSSLVGTSDKNLIGSSSILLGDPSQSLGRVTVNQSQAALISLDYARARINYLGISKFYNGTYPLEEMNVIEVTYLNLTREPWSGSDILTLSARNEGVISYQLPIFDKGRDITFTATGGWPGTATETLTQLGGAGAINRRTLIRVVFVKIGITVGGG